MSSPAQSSAWKARPPSLQGLVRNAGTWPVVLLIPVLLLVPTKVSGQNATDELPKIRRILVPVDKIGQFLSPAESPPDAARKEWLPIPRKDYEALLAAARPTAPGPPSAWIELAEYSATFAGDTLRNGRWTAKIERRSEAPQLLPLDPLNLAVSRLQWEKGEAVWGSTPDGRTALWVDRRGEQLQGEWSLKGRRLPRSVEFHVKIAPATVSRLRLQLPAGYFVLSSAGEVRQAASVGDRSPTGTAGAIGTAGTGSSKDSTDLPKVDPAGWSEWHIDLGSQSECQLTIAPQQETPAAQPQLLATRDSVYVIREESVQFKTDFTVEVLDGAVDQLIFMVPDDVQVHSVTYGGDASVLSWKISRTAKSAKAAAEQRLTVEFPDALRGRSRSIGIQGVAPVRLDEQWILPQALLRNAVLMTGQSKCSLNLQVAPPLVLRSFDSRGYRQTAIVSDPNAGDGLTFHQYLPDAHLAIDAGYAVSIPSARAVMHLNTGGETWSLRSEIEWRSRGGSTFTARCALSPEWEITDVRSQGDSPLQRLTHWEVKQDDDGGGVLELGFLEALAPGRFKTIEVLAQRLPVAPGQSCSLPILQPLDCDGTEVLLAVSDSPAAESVLRPGSPFERIDAADAPEFARQSSLWSEILADERALLLWSSAPAPGGVLDFQEPDYPVEARAQVVLTLDADRLMESFLLQFEPKAAAVDHVFVYFTSAGAAPNWQLLSHRKNELAASRVPPARHVEWNLPSRGELWEVRLPAPQRDRFRIVAGRSAALASSMTPSLAFVPKSLGFRGTVELRLKGDQAVDVQTEGLRPIDGSDGDRPPSSLPLLRPIRLWDYRTLTDQLSLEFPKDPGPDASRPLAAAVLESLLVCGKGGHDIHRARFSLDQASSNGAFRFQLPPPAELVAVLLNGQVVHPTRQQSELVLSPLPEDRHNTVEVRYRTPSSPGGVSVSQSVAVPQTSHTILRFDWRFALPPNVDVAKEPEAVSLNQPLPPLLWTRRFFGPLGRPSEGALFRPWDADHWRTLLAGETAELHAEEPGAAAVSKEDAAAFAPEGWTVREGTAPDIPATLTIQTWNQSRAHTWAWATFFGCLIAGIVLRFARAPFRHRFGAAWLGVCIVAAWLAPSAYAEIVGGCLAGTLIAVLPSQHVLSWERRRVRVTEASALGSTKSFHRVPANLLLIGLILSASTAVAEELLLAAQSSSVVHPASETRTTPMNGESSLAQAGEESRSTVTRAESAASFEVVVPVDDQLNPSNKLTVVYVTRELLAKLQQIQQNRRRTPEYLVTSGDYQAVIDAQKSVTITAKYKVALLSADPRPRVRLPIAFANLGGADACLVDGKPQPVFRSPDGGRFIVEIPAASAGHDRSTTPETTTSQTPDAPSQSIRTVEIALRLHPPTTASPAGGSFKMAVPPVAASRLSLQLALETSALEVPEALGEAAVNTTARTLSAELGKIDQFHVVWSQDMISPRRNLSLEADVACLVEAFPTRLEFHYRVAYRILQGQLDYVTWHVPPEFLVRKVAADQLLPRSVLPMRDRDSRLLIEFQSPQTGEVLVEAWFTMPLRPGTNDIRIPAIHLLGTAAESAGVGRHVESRTNGSADERRVGFQPARRDLKHGSGDSHGQAGSLPYGGGEADAVRIVSNRVGIATSSEFRTGPPIYDATRVTKLSPDLFPKSWSTATGTQQPQLTLQMTEPTDISLELTPLAPRRRIWKKQFGRVGKREILWTLTAEIEIMTAPAFQHVLILDPRLMIDSVSVQETGAERLLRWSRDGERLILFLSGKTAGIQTLVVQARLPLEPAAPANLPFVRFEGADVVESNLRLTHEADLIVELLEPHLLTPIEGPSAPERATKGKEIVLGQFRLTDEDKPPAIQHRLRRAPVSVDSATIAREQVGGHWELSTLLRIAPGSQRLPQVRIRVPEELASNFHLETTGMQVTRPPDEQADAGSLDVILEPTGLSGEDLLVSITATAEASDTPDWRLPRISVAEAETGVHYLLLASRTGLFSAAGPAVVKLQHADLPSWIPIAAAFQPKDEAWDVYRADSLGWKVSRKSDDKAEQPATAPLMQTKIWLNSQAVAFGETTVFVVRLAGRPLDWNWPLDTELRALFVNGRAVPPPTPAAGKLSLPLDPALPAHTVTIFWSRPSAEGRSLLGVLSEQLPQPRTLAIERSVLAFVPPPDQRLARRSGFTRLDSLGLALDRLDGLVDVAEAQSSAGLAQPELWDALGEQQDDLNRQWSLLQASGEPSAVSADRRDRVARLGARIEKLRNSAPETGSHAGVAAFGSRAAAPADRYLPAANWKGSISAANRRPVYARLPAESLLSPLSFWVFDNRLIAGFGAVLGLIVFLPLAGRLITPENGAWFEDRPAIAWLLIGLFWWVGLAYSFVGLAVAIIAVAAALGRFARPAEQQTVAAPAES